MAIDEVLDVVRLLGLLSAGHISRPTVALGRIGAIGLRLATAGEVDHGPLVRDAARADFAGVP
jgi:hypothetical protein